MKPHEKWLPFSTVSSPQDCFHSTAPLSHRQNWTTRIVGVVWFKVYWETPKAYCMQISNQFSRLPNWLEAATSRVILASPSAKPLRCDANCHYWHIFQIYVDVCWSSKILIFRNTLQVPICNILVPILYILHILRNTFHIIFFLRDVRVRRASSIPSIPLHSPVQFHLDSRKGLRFFFFTRTRVFKRELILDPLWSREHCGGCRLMLTCSVTYRARSVPETSLN